MSRPEAAWVDAGIMCTVLRRFMFRYLGAPSASFKGDAPMSLFLTDTRLASWPDTPAGRATMEAIDELPDEVLLCHSFGLWEHFSKLRAL